jgi:hypothetical protein
MLNTGRSLITGQVRLSTGLPGARAVWRGCSSDGRFAGTGHSLLGRRGGEYSSMASGTARMHRRTPTRGFWGWGPPGGKPGGLETTQCPRHLAWLARPTQGHLRRIGMPLHTAELALWYPDHGPNVQPDAERWVSLPCPACQHGRGQLQLTIFSGHSICLAWSLTSDDEGSAASARGGGPLGPHWLEHLRQDRVAQPVVAS